MLNRFLRKSQTSQRYLHKRQEIIKPQTNTGKREWIVARSLCFYRLFDLTAIPAARRSEALKLKIRQWTPLSRYANYIVWQGAIAQVWIWDADIQTEQQQALKVKSAYAIPETLLYAKLQEGIQLIQCIEGVEAQYWQDDVLKHSRWWATEPTLKQWADFQRICSLTVNTNIPSPIRSPLSNKPWGYHRTSINTMALQQESLWILLGLAAFVMILAWYGVKILKWQQAIKQIDQQIETLNVDATPILTAKTAAIQNKQEADKLVKLNPYPHQLDLMGQVIEALPSSTVKLVAWRYELGKLSFTVEGELLDPRKYVKAYERINLFEEVKTENTLKNNELSVLMQVKPAFSNPNDAKPLKIATEPDNEPEPPPGAIVQKVDVEGLGSGEDFDWSKIPLPDFDKLKRQQ